MTNQIALYARVSSVKQAQSNTIASQISALEDRIKNDGYTLLDELRFIDNGHSGSNLVRPSLEQLRDKVSLGEVDKIYIHSPDRLSRKYAYQMILLEEFHRAGTEIIFLNYQIDNNPESHLLLQMQGMIAEYERAKIMERNRRGKIHAAKRGSVNVLGGAPYGYRYINKHNDSGEARLEINEQESEVIQKIFYWIGLDRLSIGEVQRRLGQMQIPTQKGKAYWDRSAIWGMLKNPAYKGHAAFGKTKVGAKLPIVRPQKNSSYQPKKNYSVFSVPEENWIYVTVPAIIDEGLFAIVQDQLEENGKLARTRKRGATYLLQGLLVCKQCDYAFYGKPVKNKRGEKIDSYAYYRCIGTDAYRFGGHKICTNKQIRTDNLEIAVWEEIKDLLKNPNRILEEYQRRILELEESPFDHTYDSAEKQKAKLQRGIARLIDSYAQESIDKGEFEPRVKAMKQRLASIEEQQTKIIAQKTLKNELRLITTSLEKFTISIDSNLDNLDWTIKRDIIRSLVKRIEINHEDINIVFRINEMPFFQNEKNKSLQHCCESNKSTTC